MRTSRNSDVAYHRRLADDDNAGLLYIILGGGLVFLIVVGVSCYLWNPFRTKEPEMRKSQTNFRDLGNVHKAYSGL